MKTVSSFRVITFSALALLAATQTICAMDVVGGGAGDSGVPPRHKWGADTLLGGPWVQNAAVAAVSAAAESPDSMADHPFHIWNSLDYKERRFLIGTLQDIHFFHQPGRKENSIDKLHLWKKYLGLNKDYLSACSEAGHKKKVEQLLSASFIYGLACHSSTNDSVLYLATPSFIEGHPWAVLRGVFIDNEDGSRRLRVSVSQEAQGLMFLHEDGAVHADTLAPVSADNLPADVFHFLRTQTSVARMNALHDPSRQSISVAGAQSSWEKGAELLVASGHITSVEAPHDFYASVRRAVAGHVPPSDVKPVLGVGPREICPAGAPCPFTDRFHLQCLLDALGLPSEHKNDASYRPKDVKEPLRARFDAMGVLPHISSASLDAFLGMVKAGGDVAINTFMVMAPRICERPTSGFEKNECTVKQMIYIPIYVRDDDGAFTGLPVGFYFACSPFTKKFTEFDRFDVYHAISAEEMRNYMVVNRPPLSPEYCAGAQLEKLLTTPYEILAMEIAMAAAPAGK